MLKKQNVRLRDIIHMTPFQRLTNCSPVKQLGNLMVRFIHPYSLPCDIADALGVDISNFISLNNLIAYLTSNSCHPKKLKKFMAREDAEEAFRNAFRIDHFPKISLCYYPFKSGCIEFILYFDEFSRLRRIYLQSNLIVSEEALEIPLYSKIQ